MTLIEYLKILILIRFRTRSHFIIDFSWLFSFPYFTYKAYNDYLNNGFESSNVLTTSIVLPLLLFIHPFYIFYIYRKSYYSKENLLAREMTIEFDDSKMALKTDYHTSSIENESINEIMIYKVYITIDFYQNFIIINRKSITKEEDDSLLILLNGIKNKLKKKSSN